jgi:tRNA(Ile)-lysidine synthase
VSRPDGPVVPNGADGLSRDVRERVARWVPEGQALCVALSGGLDSTTLLDILADDDFMRTRPVSAVHVHHGLSPHAEDWVRHCERFCANHGVPLTVERVHVDRASPLGIEAAARVARYAVFAGRPERYLVLAHHLDDQAETVLLQLLRGTGLKGIAAMPEVRELRGTGIHLVRPMLEHPREALEAYAKAQALRWVDDESNVALTYDRNYLRHEVAPRLAARHGGWRESLARFARHAAGANAMLDELATMDGVPAAPGDPFTLPEGLSEERRANALRAFLARNAVAMPSESRLAEMSRQLFEARADAQVRIDHAGVSIVRHRNQAFVERSLEPVTPWRIEWQREPAVRLGAERGEVQFVASVGEGISRRALDQAGWYFAPRAGGETLRLGTGRPTRTLKNLLQENDIATWDRERLPLLFHNERLVWVPGVGIADEYACSPGEEGLKPLWKVAGKAPLC